MKKIRILASALAVMLLLFVFAACGETEKPADSAEQTTAAASATTAAEVTTESIYDANGYIKDKLPSDLGFDGATVHMLYWEDAENQEFFAEDENGETVNDSIYKRNAKVEDRLNIKFQYTGVKGNWSNYTTFVDTLRNSITGGNTDVYDIAASYSLTAGVCAYQGYVQPMNNLKYIDFDAEWWPASLTEQSMINGKLYFASGDISTNLLYMMYAVFYNKDMIKDRNLADPYSFVQSGEWTLDKMIEMSKGVYSDTESDGQKSAGDTYAQQCYYLHMDAYLYGAGVVMVKTGADGKLAVTDDFQSTKMTDLTTKIREYINSADCNIYSNGDYKVNFAAGRSLFITDRADIAVFDMSEKVMEMGILPIPKYNADQADYRNAVGNPFTLYQIPNNAQNADMSAAVLECLASESYRLVTPAIFELSMKTRYSDGGSDVESYDILRNGVVYDLGRIFGRVFDAAGITSPGTMYQNTIKNDGVSFSTTYKVGKNQLNKIIGKINDALAG